jgi:lipopolysaccharide/colanic/teichoic acid biosynthesis glycosyltransferase
MPSFYEKTGKRVFDVAASAIGLIVLSPLFVIVAVAVKLASPGPAIFRQIRIGQFEMPFCILKFRSMRAAPQGSGSLLTAAGDPRITALGYWLRRTKIDEIPQLWNVLRGDMSLVGPAPKFRTIRPGTMHDSDGYFPQSPVSHRLKSILTKSFSWPPEPIRTSSMSPKSFLQSSKLILPTVRKFASFPT